MIQKIVGGVVLWSVVGMMPCAMGMGVKRKINPSFPQRVWAMDLGNAIKSGSSSDALALLNNKPPSAKIASGVFNKSRRTWLMVAVRNSLYEVALRILDYVPENDRLSYLYLKDKDGRTAIWYLVEKGKKDIAESLTAYAMGLKSNVSQLIEPMDEDKKPEK
jgi:hypothetical protein